MSLEYYEGELDELQEKITSQILSVRRLKGREKEEKCREIKEKISSAQKMLKSMRREAKNADDPNLKSKFDDARKRRRDQIADLENKLNMAKEQSDRQELLNEKNEKKDKKKKKKGEDSDEEAEGKSRKKKRHEEEKDLGEELFKEIFETQEDSIRILERMIHKADESEALAQESMEMLKVQGEQIARIDQKMDELGSAITRGGRELKSLMRKLATEKLIILCVALIALGIAGLIAWGLINRYCKVCRFAKNRKKQNNTNSISQYSGSSLSFPSLVTEILYFFLDNTMEI